MRLFCAYQVWFSAPFYFTLLFLSNISSKLLHIAQHIQSLPLLYLILFSPTLFIPDIFVLCVGRFLLRASETHLQVLGCGLGALLGVVTWGAAAVQFGFFLETGAEVEWKAGSRFAGDPAAIKLLLSGLKSVCFSAMVILTVSWMVTPYLHTLTGKAFLGLRRRFFRTSRDDGSGTEPLLPSTKPKEMSCRRNWQIILPTMSVAIALMVLQLARPPVPYDHLSGALPLTLLEMFEKPAIVCHENYDYPFPEQISEQSWEPPYGDFPGWAPTNGSVSTGPKACPVWFPSCPYPGFHRWTDGVEESQPQEPQEIENEGECPARAHITYDPTTDPTKISNLDLAPFGLLTEAFEKNNVDIEHVVLLSLESARKDVFPMQQGGFLWNSVLNSHESERQAEIEDALSRMTPVAQMITDEWALNSEGIRNNFSDAIWQDHAAPGMGGINVKGALTGSTLTFKSLLGSHCGVNPLAVDMLDEVKYNIYQPCLPHIFRMLNDITAKHHPPKPISETDFRDRAWATVFTQSITDTYDHQRQLNQNMGFHSVVTKETITRSGAKHPPKGEEINYFGYAESAIDPYVRDLIYDAAKNETRLFLSHITSTTHHPWALPEDYPKKEYFGSNGGLLSSHEDTNNYLNTVAYVDNWLGRILKYIDGAGIADKTLVVFVGDHGQAFEEDSTVTGTFENPHISNFRVPLVFRHPRLPRIDVNANITSLSIIPTILDLLINTKSLNTESSTAASSLIHEYQGQSILRPIRTTSADHKDSSSSPASPPPLNINRKASDKTSTRPLWVMSIINGGGKMLSVASANTPFRLVIPVDREYNMFQYRFTHTAADPDERHPIQAWSVKRFRKLIREKYGEEASHWTKDAMKVGGWWIEEQRRVWEYRD